MTNNPYYSNKDIIIYNDNILEITEIPKLSVDLIITSPPYNLDVDYDTYEDSLSYNHYLNFTRDWLRKCFYLSKENGRICINIPIDKNKRGIQPIYVDVISIARDIGWKYKTTIVWDKQIRFGNTAWGSWKSASAPNVNAYVELIAVLYKSQWKKEKGESDITKEEFMNWTNGMWSIPNRHSAINSQHPAIFPVEIPTRCIKLFSYVNDTIMDPFLGSGSTLIAARDTNRKCIGVDIDKKYCDTAIKRWSVFQTKLKI